MTFHNERDFKHKQELIVFNHGKGNVKYTINEAKQLLNTLQIKIMYAETNELISRFLRMNGMDEAWIETAITQLNKLREK